MVRGRMLIVEDEPTAGRVMQALFGRRGWEVTLARSVADGLAGLHDNPDCVVLDLMLPDGDGEEVLREVRGSGRPCRVVVTTGVDDPERLDSARALGATALLRKPISMYDVCRICGGGGD